MTLIRCVLLVTLLSNAILAQEESRLLRFPHRQGDRIVFVKGGDLFAGTISSGEARRLTSFSEGLEVMPRISPDGEWVAFSGEYAGSRQVYIVPFMGGQPRQLTFYPDVGPMPPRGGYDNLPYDWTPDGKKILVRMNRSPYGQRVGRYFLVDPFQGGLEEPLPVPEGGAVTFSPDGKRLAYNVISREWRTWKRYRAGRAQDVHIFDLEAKSVERITDFPGTDSQPLWLGDRIYFVSDRSGTLNIWRQDLNGGTPHQVTQFKDRDVTFPSRGKGGLIFECDGYLWTMDEGSEEVQRLKIHAEDDAPFLRPQWERGPIVDEACVSPHGDELLVTLHGDLFRVYRDGSEPKQMHTKKDRIERYPIWSPTGEHVAYLAEVGDTYEVFIRDMATDEERQFSFESKSWIHDILFSPDGKLIEITDKAGVLRIGNVETREISVMDEGKFGSPNYYAWSRDSRYLTYMKPEESGLSSIWILDLKTGEAQAVTRPEFDDTRPSFDPEGRYLYFLSDRSFNYGKLDFDTRIYALLLRKDMTSPLEKQRKEEPLPESSLASDDDENVAAVEVEETKDPIDFDGIMERDLVLPIPAGEFVFCEAVKGGVLFGDGSNLKLFKWQTQESQIVVEGPRAGFMAAKSETLIYVYRNVLHHKALRSGGKGELFNTNLIQVRILPKEEWRRIFFDAWRVMRDWFYDPQLHRVDWLQVRERYEPLLAHMTHRSDLDLILGEMIGELNVGHAYVQSPRTLSPKRVDVGCLGCELLRDGEHYRIGHIFSSENWTETGRNPLRAPGISVKEGAYLLAIDGETLKIHDNPYRLLEGKAERETTLLIADTADLAQTREVVVKPVRSETSLRYIDWVARNRKIVDERSEGRIGYIHVPNTAIEGHRRFMEGMTAYARTKDALIIDDRYNGGGFIPDRMAQILDTKPMNYWSRRHSELKPEPEVSFAGKSVMLINGYSSSGGDAFPYYYKKLGTGLLIGTKTWGGLVGISFDPPLLDQGRIRVPSFAFVNDQGEWAVEGEGVDPDIEVVDDAGRVARGEEPVLEAAIAHLLAELEKDGSSKRPAVPEGPDRSK